MDALTVHVHGDLPKRIQPSLTCPPVEFGAPVLAQLFEVAPAGPVGPATAREFVEPPGTSQPLTQVIELVIRNVNLVRHNTACHVFLLQHQSSGTGKQLQGSQAAGNGRRRCTRANSRRAALVEAKLCVDVGIDAGRHAAAFSFLRSSKWSTTSTTS